jgi:hypothetical protein
VIFQLSLVEREINEVIRGAFQPSQTSSRSKERSQNVNPSDNRNKQKQKEITDEDVCPICQDELLVKSGKPLTYCKYVKWFDTEIDLLLPPTNKAMVWNNYWWRFNFPKFKLYFWIIFAFWHFSGLSFKIGTYYLGDAKIHVAMFSAIWLVEALMNI